MISPRSLALFALLAGSALTAPAVKRRASGTPFTNSSSGIFFNIGQNYADEWQGFQSGTGKTPAGISVYGDIYSGALNSDSQNLLSTYAGNNTGYVEVGMSWKDDMTNNGYTQYQGAQLCNDIASGKYDPTITNLGKYLAGFPQMYYLLRVDYEVSGNLHANTNPSQFDASTFDTTAYPKAFTHIRALLTPLVPQISFVYHAVRGEARLLYPGDAAVDYHGFSIFNNDVCLAVASTTNCPGASVDDNLLSDIQWAPKPKIVAESAAQPPAVGSAEGFVGYLAAVKKVVEGEGFVGWTYINSNWVSHGWDPSTWGDSRVEAQPEVLQWFRENIGDNPRYTWG